MIGDTGSVRAPLWTLRACWAMAVVAVAGGAAAQQLELEEEVRLMEAPPWGAIREPHLPTHPEDPEWLVGGVIVQDTAGAVPTSATVAGCCRRTAAGAGATASSTSA